MATLIPWLVSASTSVNTLRSDHEYVKCIGVSAVKYLRTFVYPYQFQSENWPAIQSANHTCQGKSDKIFGRNATGTPSLAAHLSARIISQNRIARNNSRSENSNLVRAVRATSIAGMNSARPECRKQPSLHFSVDAAQTLYPDALAAINEIPQL